MTLTRHPFLIGVMGSIALAIIACRPETPRTRATDREVQSRSETRPASGAPRRVLSLAPSLTEIVFAVGAGNSLVGVDAYSDFPPEARLLPKLGGLVDPDLEGMLRLRPDLALLLASQKELAGSLRAAGVPYLAVPHERLSDVEAAIREIGRRLGQAGAADVLADSLRGALERARSGVPPGGGPRVLFVVARDPGPVAGFTAAGAGTYLDELIALAGGRNVMAGSAIRYPQVSAESALRLRPDLILEWSPVSVGVAVEQVAAGDRRIASDWRRLVKPLGPSAGRVHVLHDDLWLRPGPRLIQALSRLRPLISP